MNANTQNLIEEMADLLNEEPEVPLMSVLDELERALILQRARRFEGNITHMAASFCINRTTLFEKVRKHGLLKAVVLYRPPTKKVTI